ncbi:MAG: PIN domain-containing protein [Methanolinea sp.]|jgi:predicted nucleic acid-binding protein
MTAPDALIDTNILGYVFDADVPTKRAVSRDLLAQCWNGEVTFAVSVQNLAEFAVVVTEKVAFPMPQSVVRSFIETILNFDGWKVISYRGSTIQDALAIKEKYSLHFWDALIVATMQEHGIHQIYTEDRGFAKVPGCIPVNPYEMCV